MIDDLGDVLAEVASGAVELAGEVVGVAIAGALEVADEIFEGSDAPASGEDEETAKKGGKK